MNLNIAFLDDYRTIGPAEQLTFGRSADVPLDSNRHLHRVVGRFFHENGLWWIKNEGATLTIHVGDRNSTSTMSVAPRTAAPLPYQRSVLRVAAGKATYELELQLEAKLPSWHADDSAGAEELANQTISPHSTPLNVEQRQLLAAFAANVLRDPLAPLRLPSNGEVAKSLGWSATKLNRKLDNLCVKFDKLGVPGLRGSQSQLATDRRRNLVEHCVSCGLISSDDLVLLDPESSGR